MTIKLREETKSGRGERKVQAQNNEKKNLGLNKSNRKKEEV